MVIRRIAIGDRELARATFAMIATVFDEPRRPLSDDYVDALLARDEPRWSPDGTKLVVSSLTGDTAITGWDIVVMNADGSERRILTPRASTPTRRGRPTGTGFSTSTGATRWPERSTARSTECLPPAAPPKL